MNKISNVLKKYFEKFFGEKVKKISVIPQSGSYRKYFRLQSRLRQVIGTFNADVRENEAFFYFTGIFFKKGLKVPEIYFISDDRKFYLQEDLGDTSLFDFIKNQKNNNSLLVIYRQVIEDLIKFQFDTVKDINFDFAYPRPVFDRRAILWDLNYFKYFVLKPLKVPFNEERLENDFDLFVSFLTSFDNNFFMYRDFQSSNIMLKEGKPYYIDYQGGRKGSFYYDLASLLYDSKAGLSGDFMEEIKKFYYEKIRYFIQISFDEFLVGFNAFSLVRMLQAFGAYGFRGLVEKKLRFIKSIPRALENIKTLTTVSSSLMLPELTKSLEFLATQSEVLPSKGFSNLTLEINSFSYIKNGYPINNQGNGGGFVFDCRLLPNPGRLEKFRNLTGLDKAVSDYLLARQEVQRFLGYVFDILKDAIKSYNERGYTDLQINFGCTGGQHRSVFCAEAMANLISLFFDVKIKKNHLAL